ncbi:hypothetical protein ACFL12_03210 [Pseudomonadota bacterium]
MEFRNVKLSEHEQVKDLYEDFYGPNYCEVERVFYTWLHHANPCRSLSASADEFTAFGAFQEGELLSCINYVPFKMVVQDHEYKSCWSVGWRVKDDRPGLAGFLLKRQIKNFDFYMSMGATQWVKSIYTTQFKFSYQHNIPRAIMVGNAVQTEEILRMNDTLILDDFGDIVQWADETRRAAEAGQYVFITDGSALNPQYWSDHRERVKATVSKEPAVLNWRYVSHPLMQYDIISTTSDQSAGIAVLRTEQSRDQDFRVVRLLEFLPTKNNEKALSAAVARYTLDKSAAFLDFFCGNDTFIQQHMPTPFIQQQDHQPYLFPRMFQPLEWRERYSINASFRQFAGGEAPSLKMNDVYFTKGDPSQDILLNREYVTKLL